MLHIYIMVVSLPLCDIYTMFKHAFANWGFKLTIAEIAFDLHSIAFE